MFHFLLLQNNVWNQMYTINLFLLVSFYTSCQGDFSNVFFFTKNNVCVTQYYCFTCMKIQYMFFYCNCCCSLYCDCSYSFDCDCSNSFYCDCWYSFHCDCWYSFHCYCCYSFDCDCCYSFDCDNYCMILYH